MLTVHAPDPNFNGQVLSVRFRDGVAQVNENAAVTLGVLRARGFRVEGDYDPAEHTVPEVVARAAHTLYAGSGAVTDYRAFPDRGHSLVLDHGWREIADYTLTWLNAQGL